MIFNSAARAISRKCIDLGIIEKDELSVYIYCFELLLSTIANTFIILTITMMFNQWGAGLIFSGIMISLRQVIGGYHARSHLQCSALLILVFLAYLYIIGKSFEPNIILLIGVIAFILSIVLGPVEHKNKQPVEKKTLKKIRLFSIGMTGGLLFVSFLLIQMEMLNIALEVNVSMAIVVIAAAVGKLNNQ